MAPHSRASALLQTFRRFLGVGAVGFLVDALAFFALVSGLGVHYVWSRIAASFIALLVTWLLNRRVTFSAGRADPAPVEFLRYLGASAAGASSNLVALSVIAPYDAAFAHIPSYLAGAAVGLVVNFFLYDKFVFHGRARPVALNPKPPESS